MTPRSTVNVLPLIDVIYNCSESMRIVWAGPRFAADVTEADVAVVDPIASDVVTLTVSVV